MQCTLPPLRLSLQKFVLFETRNVGSFCCSHSHCLQCLLFAFSHDQKFYLVASDRREEHYQLLKIDRTRPFELNVDEDQGKYSKQQMLGMLAMIHAANENNGGIKRLLDAQGIVGMSLMRSGRCNN